MAADSCVHGSGRVLEGLKITESHPLADDRRLGTENHPLDSDKTSNSAGAGVVEANGQRSS